MDLKIILLDYQNNYLVQQNFQICWYLSYICRYFSKIVLSSIDKNSHIHKNTHTFINIHVRNKFYNHHKNKSLVKINIKSYELNEMNDKTNSCDTKRR